MATSGSTDFDLEIDEIIQDAYERCGYSGTRTGYQLRSARRSLNLLFSEWGNRGVHIWKVVNHTQSLTAGSTEYTAPTDAADVLEMVFRNSSSVDTTMTKISRSEYQAIPNKTQQGTPTQYFIQRNRANVKINIYLAPDTTGTNLNYYYIKRIQDVGAYTNTSDAPFRFLPCMVSGLAYYVSQKVSPERTQALKLYYEDELQRALTEDSQSTSVHIVPQNYFVSS